MKRMGQGFENEIRDENQISYIFFFENLLVPRGKAYLQLRRSRRLASAPGTTLVPTEDQQSHPIFKKWRKKYVTNREI